MQTVYCVWGSSGSYDDYATYIIEAFFDQNEAEKFKDNYNEDLIESKKQYYICDECMNRFCETQISKPESQQKFIESRKHECELSNIEIDDEGYIRCKNQITWYDSNDLHNAEVKQLEVW
jgi:hypothetical protein